MHGMFLFRRPQPHHAEHRYFHVVAGWVVLGHDSDFLGCLALRQGRVIDRACDTCLGTVSASVFDGKPADEQYTFEMRCVAN